MKTPQKVLDGIRRWRAANPDKVKACYHRYKERHQMLVRMRNRDWHIKNKLAKSAKHERDKEAVINVLTNGEGTCRWCGQGDLDVLCLDHVNDNGAAHRRTIKTTNSYQWIIKHGYPEGFQVLCFNCNMKKDMQRRRTALAVA